METRILYFLLSIGCLLLIYKSFKTNQTNVIKYPNFGIRIPAGYETHGIDVSRYQSAIDWGQVVKMRDRGQKISFAIIKSTEGLSLKDPHFEYNWKKSKENKLIRGSYFYFHANCDAESQARFYINNTKLKTGDLPPIIDIEDSYNMPPTQIRASLKKCIQVLENKYKKKPIIYTGAHFYHQNLGKEFDEYPLWVAHYGNINAPRVNRNWDMWQHSERGRVNGIVGHVDFNVFKGSQQSLLRRRG